MLHRICIIIFPNEAAIPVIYAIVAQSLTTDSAEVLTVFHSWVRGFLMTKKITLFVKKTRQQLLDPTEQKCVKSTLFRDDFKRTQVIKSSQAQLKVLEFVALSHSGECVCVLA